MDKTEFQKELLMQAKKMEIIINEKQTNDFYTYMQLLLEWNKKINLTAITEENEIITKHFIDSLTLLKYIKEGESIIDVGTGAGFPGIPLKIIMEQNQFTLLDSLHKRVVFLEECKNKIELKKTEIIHGRAEEFGSKIEYREKYDVAVSRAVAPLNALLEYVIPFIKVGGEFLCMKGPKVEEEILESKKAIEELGVEIEEIKEISLSNENQRRIVMFRKKEKTKSIYPRKFVNIKKKPL